MVAYRIKQIPVMGDEQESLLRSKADVKRLRDGVIAEDIAVEVEYRDKNGWTRNVSMPVLLSVITQGMMSEAGA